MKDILINFASPALGNNVIFDTDDINGLNDPWKLLKKKLYNLGYNLKTADQNELSNCAWIFFIDGDSADLASQTFKDKLKYNVKKIMSPNAGPARKLYQECLREGMTDKLVLFLWEGKSVKPYNYSTQLHEKFSKIFTWNDDLVDNKKFFKLYLPSSMRNLEIAKMPFLHKKLLINISANKLSPFPDELYSARRKTIKFFDKNHPNDFDLYGPKWDTPISRLQKKLPCLVKRYGTFRGIAKNKIETLSKYKFSLCYENLKNENGYITEKIFDCFIAKTVPIYWGANNIEEYIDSECFIDRRQFNSDKELAELLKAMTETEYNAYLANINKYLRSEAYQKFLPENFAATIINALKL